MTFSKAAFKSAVFSTLTLAGTAAFATPAPTAVPEPSSWIPLTIGAVVIAAMVAWNRSKAAKINN